MAQLQQLNSEERDILDELSFLLDKNEICEYLSDYLTQLTYLADRLNYSDQVLVMQMFSAKLAELSGVVVGVPARSSGIIDIELQPSAFVEFILSHLKYIRSFLNFYIAQEFSADSSVLMCVTVNRLLDNDLMLVSRIVNRAG